MSRKQFICVCCGKAYYSYKEKSSFCSKECKHKWAYIDYECDYCGNTFLLARSVYDNKRNKRHYCSRKCANKGAVTSSIKKCVFCGKEFSVEASEAESRKFCSYECYNQSRSSQPTISVKVCKFCGMNFTTYHHNQIYCSKQCSAESQRKRVKCICDYCGKTFERKSSDVENTRKHFCSVECRNTFYSWSKDDIDVLKVYYGKKSLYEIQQMLSAWRSVRAISSMIQRLGFSKNRKWTLDEEACLVANYSTMPTKTLSALLPNRTVCSIIGKAQSLGLHSHFYNTHLYSEYDVAFLKENYLTMSDYELALHLGRNEYGVEQKLRMLGLIRPHEIKKDGYRGIAAYIRARLAFWKDEVRHSNNYTCCVTGSKSNLVIHHCHGFNLILEEAMEVCELDNRNCLDDYSDEELNYLFDVFFALQESYNAYVCITESVHREFHTIFGYGDNTVEQWNEFIEHRKANRC